MTFDILGRRQRKGVCPRKGSVQWSLTSQDNSDWARAFNNKECRRIVKQFSSLKDQKIFLRQLLSTPGNATYRILRFEVTPSPRLIPLVYLILFLIILRCKPMHRNSWVMFPEKVLNCAQWQSFPGQWERALVGVWEATMYQISSELFNRWHSGRQSKESGVDQTTVLRLLYKPRLTFWKHCCRPSVLWVT